MTALTHDDQRAQHPSPYVAAQLRDADRRTPGTVAHFHDVHTAWILERATAAVAPKLRAVD